MTLRGLAALLLPGSARAAFWTATTNYAVVPTTEVYTYTDDYYSTTETVTDVYSSYVSLAEDASLDPQSAYSTSTYEDSYGDLELVILYYDGGSIPEEAIAMTSEYDYDATTTYTYYVQEITYTAPSSCETQFEVPTVTTVYIPPEVTDQITPTSMDTTTDSYYDEVVVVAYIEPDAAPMTTDYDYDYIYDYVQSCINPTETGSFDDWYGDDDYTDGLDDANPGTIPNGSDGDENGTADNNNSTVTYDCNAFNSCGSMAAWAIAIAAVLPAIFLLGFLESYFWFRRMMMGRSALRFGTCCWILLLIPILCFTRKVPAREAVDQEALREKWRKTSVSKAVDLWLSWGFRLRYPVEVLGVHSKYNNPPIGPNGKALPDTGYIPQTPPKGYMYYVAEAADGAAGATRGAAGKSRSSRHPEMATAAAPGQPRYPPQAHSQRQHRQSRSQRQPAAAMPSDPQAQAGHLSLPPQIPTPQLPGPIPEPSPPTDEREAPTPAEQTEQPRPVSPERTTDHPPAPQHDPPSPPLPPRPVQQPDSTEPRPSTDRREG